MMYATIEKEASGKLGTAALCSALGVSESGYRKWLKREPSHDPYEMEVRSEMQKIALEFPFYGYRRMTGELDNRGFPVNEKRVRRLMKIDNLLCIRKTFFRPMTTDSNHNFPVYPNLAKGLLVTGMNQLWVSDITYIRLEKEFVYLAVIMDVFSRRVVGWELSRSLDASITLNALDMAFSNRKGMDLAGLIHHSDQGVQYACSEYTAKLEARGIRISMSRKGNPYDNAIAESFMKTLKVEEVYLQEYTSFRDARKNIGRFIDEVYNKKRLHSSIGYRSPEEFEKEVCLLA
jgi:transposase InsO family protein